ncbi:hypothetical protein AO985_31250 [Pseudomonas aeruginosa]|nr:hypothetical protein AO985_31250 [Pseudomonas aeruginosa]
MLFAPTLADRAILPTAWRGRYFFNRIGLMLTFMLLWNMFGALWLLPALARFLINPAKLQARKASLFAH